MAVADFLKDIGKGVEATGRVAGAIAEPLGRSIAEEEAGYAPEIVAEKRQQADKATDAKVQELESQLEMGRKYGTLTTEQQNEYVRAISQLYSHPSQMGTLVQKLHKAVHPRGAPYQPYAPPLANATPEGGTVAQDEATREKALADSLGLRQQTTDEEIDRRAADTAKNHKPAGMSPRTPGNQIPPDALGPDGQPIPSAMRTAGQSFIEWNGAWYSAPKAKPVLRMVGSDLLLIDPATGAVMRKVASAQAKVSSHQTPYVGDDGQMHMATEYSVALPTGETIYADASPLGANESGQSPVGGGGESKPPSSAPAKKVTPGAILPKTGAKPVAAAPGGMGPAIPGSHTWAQSKSPLFKSDVEAYTKANEDLTAKKEAFESAQTALNQPGGPTASSDQELIYAWVRSNVQGAGRMTQAEFRQAAATGSLPLRAQTAWERAKSGRLPPELEQMMFADIKRSFETATRIVGDMKAGLQTPGNTPAWSPPPDAPLAPKEDGKVLKTNGQIIARSKGGQWVQP